MNDRKNFKDGYKPSTTPSKDKGGSVTGGYQPEKSKGGSPTERPAPPKKD